ncbi:uncharacterized protein DUF2723 [Arcticibacter tournemirensis]|uniref:DUF2723 domain-containing protein n=1 Tax=Arcticibacter tournemirensis TaxID=699437 RepID=A0A5M9HLI7_9SPHI|nr:DUF2723 domain-containing protein [Arcticibacter tournemirensis]KAA8485867.1 DUF2723 domain-containing protein [Arcticibacter tournemirensis]TQM46881.1 uncharacterized protein DUF2723 [Arcticibacter tournemirensis]
MKPNTGQQQEIRSLLKESSINEDVFHELYDHIITGLEEQASSKFDIREIQVMVNNEFNELVNTQEEKRAYRRMNNALGFVLFGIALLTYWLTMEPTVSFWDCGEFIAASYKMQVGHQPGAPVFLMIANLFSLLAFGDVSKVAYWVNFSAVLASAATIMFLFWTITALALKVYRKEKIKSKATHIFTAGVIGALAFTFSDTFWFSAVEAEVYALSALFTAVTFWAILKWENQQTDRYLVFIAFIVGLSTGVHLLSLLVIPAIALVYYLRQSKNVTTYGLIKALLAGCIIVALVQFVILQYLVLLAAKFDLLFVNSLGLSFGSGALFFLLLLAGTIRWAIYYSIRTRKYKLNLGLICLTFLLLGFSSYFMILIRANAKPAINLSNPDNIFSLYGYLGRSNYGSTPLLYGNTFDAKLMENKVTGNTYRKGKTKYEISGNTYESVFDKNMVFPRIYSQKPGHDTYYRNWLNIGEKDNATFADNLRFFSTWQVGFMYWRYFLWNFSGRQNDIQSQGEIVNGNWVTGIQPLDALHLGSQTNLPQTIKANEAHNRYFGLPFIIGIAGLIWLSRKNKYSSIVLCTLFFFTGLAIILYLNQDPLQVRERDYAYAGSFYTFAIFIGFGVLALKDVFAKVTPARWSMVSAAVICFVAVPVLMGTQGWNDHDRSQKTTARDWARNYLNSCAPNAILFTNADNDTYPLWYAQEVEGIRTDVRVVCIQFLSGDAYINQMKKQLNRSAPLPISMPEEKYVDGLRDYLPYVDYGIQDSVELKELLAVLTSDNKNDQVQMNDGSFMNFLPTKRLKITIDSDQVVNTRTVKPEERSRLAPAIEWEFKKSYATKADLAMFDILATNNWKRPVYFATSVSEDTYLGLDKYLYLEGYAYRLIPFKTKDDGKDKSERTNSDVMYNNVMTKLDYKAFKKAAYLDPESRRIINSTWGFNNTLANNLISEGKADKAKDIMKKSLDELPVRNYTVSDTLARLYTVKNLYALHQIEEANKQAEATAAFLMQELDYIAALSPGFQRGYIENAQVGLYVLSSLDKLTADNHQKKLNRSIRNAFNLQVKNFG